MFSVSAIARRNLSFASARSDSHFVSFSFNAFTSSSVNGLAASPFYNIKILHFDLLDVRIFISFHTDASLFCSAAAASELSLERRVSEGLNELEDIRLRAVRVSILD